MFVTDFHGQIHDFRRVVTRFTARLARGEDLYMLFAGDFVHGPAHGQVHGWLQRDETPAILDELEQLFEAHPDRVHALLGNHEYGHLGGRATQKFYRGLDDDVQALKRRLGPKRSRSAHALFETFSLVAMAPCGMLFSHAAPNLDPRKHPKLLEKIMLARYDRADPIIMSLVWPRFVAEPEQIEGFFQAMRFKGIQPRVAAYGHEIAPRGVERSEHRQVVISSSFAIADRYKTFLEVDLAGRYNSPADLREGVELIRLYPERAIGRSPPAGMLA